MHLTFINDQIIPGLKGVTAFQVIDELVNHLASTGTVPPDAKDRVASAIKQREQSMSTGIGFGVAIPHAATPLVNEIVVAFGRSQNGIDFDSLDGQPVRLVVLVIVPACEKEKHLPTLARISRLLHGKDTRAALENAADVATISNILNGNSLIPA